MLNKVLMLSGLFAAFAFGIQASEIGNDEGTSTENVILADNDENSDESSLLAACGCKNKKPANDDQIFACGCEDELIQEEVNGGIVSADDESLESTLASDDESLESVLASDDESLESTLASDDESLESVLASDDESLESTLASDDESLENTLASDDESLEGTLASDDEGLEGDLAHHGDSEDHEDLFACDEEAGDVINA